MAILHQSILDNEWFISLTDSQARTFLHLLAYATPTDGHIMTKSLALISRRTCRDVRSIRSLLAQSEGRIIETETGFYITDWLQYNKPRDVSTDRVRKYREMKRVTETNGNMLHETPVTPHEKKKRRVREDEENTPTPFVSIWNEEAPKLGLAKILTPISPKRESAVKARSREPNFDLVQIFKKIEASDFLRGQNSRNWKADFDFVFLSSTNYHKILEGKYDSPPDNGYDF